MTGGLKVKDREKTRFFFFVSLNFLMNVGWTVGQSVSEGMFLSDERLGPARLPVVLLVTAVATAVSTFVYSFFVDKLRNDNYFQLIHIYTIGFLGIILVGIHFNLAPAVVAYYGFYYVVSGVFNTHYWNYATDYFDAVEAKRLFPFFPLGNSLGGFTGGMLTSLLADHMSNVQLSLIWVALLTATWYLIHVVSPRLKGWVVMEVEETDEASLDNMRQGFRFMMRSNMGRWHVVSAFMMVTSLAFLLYVYSAIFAAAYPRTEDLIAFIGRFLAITNIVEIVLELTFTPRLIGFLGVGASSLFYPLSTLLGFALCAGFRSVPAAVYSRMNKETFDNAITGSVRNLLYNAYPTRFRGRIRAFLEGVMSNVGVVFAGVVLIVLAQVIPKDRMLGVVMSTGVVASVLYLGVAYMVRREYLGALVKGLKDWHLDLADVSLEVDKVSDEDIFEILGELEQKEDPASMELVHKMLGILKRRRKLEPVLERLSHPNVYVQEVALDLLGDTHDMRMMPHLTRMMAEGSGRLRARALEVIRVFSPLSEILPYLEDREPTVRATTASLVIRSGDARHADRAWSVVEAMLQSESTQMRTAALWVLPMLGERGSEMLLDHVHDENPRVRLVALDRLENSDLGKIPTLPFKVATLLDDPNDEVRRVIVRLISDSQDERVIPMLARRLGDESFHVRNLAVKGLVPWGMKCLREVQPYLASRASTSVDAAVAVLASIEAPEVRESVLLFIRELVNQSHETVIGLAVLEEATEAGADNLAVVAMQDFLQRARNHVFHALEYLEDANVIRNIRRCIETTHRQARGDAMEALSNLGDRQMMPGFVALFDDSPLKEQLGFSLRWVGRDAAPPWKEVVTRNLRHRDRWVRAGTLYTARLRAWEVGGTNGAETEEFTVMKNLLFLKKVPLFAQMSLEQLEVISRIVNELSFFAGEPIFKENEIGDELYIIVEGKVSIIKNYRTPHELVLATLKETDYFGEMAVLDNEPRSASVVVAEDARLLSISGAKLRDIVHQKPEIAFEIFKVLSSRLRKADQRLGDLTRENVVLKKQVETAPSAAGAA